MCSDMDFRERFDGDKFIIRKYWDHAKEMKKKRNSFLWAEINFLFLVEEYG